MSKIAVVLFNLGGPDTKDAIKPFLYNFFTDPNIIQLPGPLRSFIAKRIAEKRSRQEAGSSYAELNYCSPLLENTVMQARALSTKLNQDSEDEYKTFVCMRYWHPMTDSVAAHVQAWRADKIILLPLYPQFSTTTTWSSLQEWNWEMGKLDYECETSMICCYPTLEGFVQVSAQNIKSAYDLARVNCETPPRLLLSAHGLPEKIIKGGDPYQWQCEQTAQAIVDALGIENLDWQICYQSRVGPLKWIGPSTDEALQKAAADNVPVIIYPHAFVSEHVETLVEIEIEYREMADELGIPYFARVPTVGAKDAFIDGLAKMVVNHQGGTTSNQGVDLCPQEFGRCCCRSVEQHAERSLLAA